MIKMTPLGSNTVPGVWCLIYLPGKVDLIEKYSLLNKRIHPDPSALAAEVKASNDHITKSGKKLPEIISGCDLHNLHKHHNYCGPYRERL